MTHPCLLFCPYLPLDGPVAFGEWELGPLQFFEGRWADPQFKSRAEAFLQRFVGPYDNHPIDNPILICRKGRELDGQEPSGEELRALELALSFAFLDCNPREYTEHEQSGWGIVTTDNMELYLWPIDLQEGRVMLTTGYLVTARILNYTMLDTALVLRPPLDLHMPAKVFSPDPLLLTGIYETVLQSLCSPGSDLTADRVRVAVDWFARAWRNTGTVHYPERLVFLKTAFEAVTGTSKTHKSAHELRRMFETLPDATEGDSEILVWSPEEKPIHTRVWRDKSIPVTDLETWFMAFGHTRNTIIHEGEVTQLTYPGTNPMQPIASRSIYHGDFFFTAELLLRGVIRVLLSELGYRDAWRSKLWRCIGDVIDDATIT